MDLAREFAIAKVLTVAAHQKLRLVQRKDIKTPTFDVFDEFIVGIPLHSATIWYDGSKWHCTGHVDDEDSRYAVCAVFTITQSPYRWEQSIYSV
jgi:hypothetical protein